MWKIFYKKESSVEKTLLSIDKCKKEIFSLLEREVKEYFSKKVITYFDNNMLFRSKQGLHVNLMEALSTTEEDMLSSSLVFGKVELYWLRQEIDDQYLIIFGLQDDKEYVLINEGFELIKKDAELENSKTEKFKFDSLKTLIFHPELVNYSAGWIKYAPDLELRTSLQTEYILLQAYMKKSEMSMLEIIDFQKNIANHTSYKDLYEKLLRVIPKIEFSLINETKENDLIDSIKPITKKKKI